MTEESNDNKLFEVLKGEDDLGAVIRAHIHIEATLNDLIASNFEYPNFIEKMNLEYHDKVIIAQAMGLKDGYAKALNSLGTLRNNFAHKLDTQLGKSEINSLYSSFHGEAKQIMQEGYRKTSKEHGIKSPKSITKLEPRETFLLIVVAMKQMLEVAKNEFKSA